MAHGDVGASRPEYAVEATGTDLKTNAVGLTGVVMQAFTAIAPAAAIVFTIAFTASLAGVQAPLAYLYGFILIFTLGVSLTQLAKYLPSSGGYFTYVARTLGPRAGFSTAWLFFAYAPFVICATIMYAGFVFEGAIKSAYGFDFPWWAFFLIALAFITAVTYFGVTLSVRFIVIMGSLEILIMLALAFSGFANPGAGGFSFRPFDVSSATSSNFFLAVIFGIAGFAGFEEAVPLAEEAENPRRTVPRALIISLVLMGVLLVIVPWGIIIGWGTAKVGALSINASPAITLANRLWGGAWIIVLLVVMNSALAASIAFQNAVTRVWYRMAYVGALPRQLAVVSGKNKTPVVALGLQTVVSLIIGLIVGLAMGPANLYFYIGIQVTVAILLIYCVGNVGVIWFYRTERRSEFKWWLHLAFPVVSSGLILYLLYKTIIPIPAAPARWALPIVGAWLVVGVILSFVISGGGRERWLTGAGVEFSAAPVSAVDSATRPGGAPGR